MSELNLPSYSDVISASEKLSGFAVKTPLLKCEKLSEELSANIYVKAECLQRVGAFKFRGAFNRLCRLTEEERNKGVVAFSSGNHAQGVAAAAKILGIKAIIVMPADAPKMKMDNTISYGAEVVTYDRATESREEIAEEISKKNGSVVVPSFEDFYIISGQGTAGLEAVDQAKEADIEFDQFISPIGGGGLISGCSLALSKKSPNTHIIGVEPDGFNDVQRSLDENKIMKNDKASGSLCDALLTINPEPMTFNIMRNNLSEVLTVTDHEALKAVKYAWENLKLVVEPGGAVALAATLAGKIDVKGKNICIMLSGGNIDAETFKKALDT